MKFFLFWKPAVWLGLICYGLFLPASDLPLKTFFNIPHFDKVIHFSLFFVFCLLLFRPLKKTGLMPFYWAPLISIFLSTLLEWFQHIVTTSRNSNFLDLLANISGIVAAALFFYFFVQNKKWEKLF